MSYLDFCLAFEPAPDTERYRIVAHSPSVGQVGAPFVSPFGETRINAWRFGLIPDEMHLIGTLLFRRVFSPEILRAYHDARRFAFRQGLALRLKLVLNDALMQLPWEFLFDPDANQFLALDQRVAIVRYFDFTFPSPASSFAEPAGMFVFAPGDPDALTRDPLTDVSNCAGMPLQSVQEIEMENGVKVLSEYRVLHIQAASGRDPATGRYAISIPDGTTMRALTSDQLARWLRVNNAVRFVFVDANGDSSASTREASALAAELVQRRVVSAAAAFQYPVSMLQRAAFFKAFYRLLAKDGGLDLALTEGRQTIAQMSGVWEWGAPVLYSAVRDDQPRMTRTQFESPAVVTVPALTHPRDVTFHMLHEELPASKK